MMWGSRALPAFYIALLGASCPSLAQSEAQAVPPPPSAVAVRSRVASALALPPQSLADVLNRVRWNPETSGTLLVVSPEKTKNQDNVVRDDGSLVIHEPRTLSDPDANGLYHMTQVEDYFDRRLIRLHSLAVLAPASMMVLNTTRLPKPNAYNGMEEEAKVRLLFSTFTSEEWHALASAEGIGTADMDASQRELYLSILPNPFEVHTVSQRVDSAQQRTWITAGDTQTLTPAQREGIRLSVAKQFDWAYHGQFGGMLGIPAPMWTAQPTLEVVFPATAFTTNSDAFGVALRQEVPSRSKTSQLPYDWSGYDIEIPLQGVKTVGELVRRIAQNTRSEIYCDPRYAGLSVWTRGSSARGGDLLHALAWAVTGTWRRLGNAFVLTDDLVGLGARHAIIENWIQECKLLATIRDTKINGLLADAHPASLIGWAADDAASPGDALIKKIDAFNDEQVRMPGSLPLLVPLADLTPAAQKLVRQRADAYTVSLPVAPGSSPPAIRTDSVYVTPRVRAVYIIPGVGTAPAPEIVGGGLAGSIFAHSGQRTKREASLPSEAAVAEAPPPSFPAGLSRRVLVVAPLTTVEVNQSAHEARRRGFTELWVQVPKGDSALLEDAATACAANGLAIRPVLRLLRAADPTVKPDQLDRNLLGQTVSEHATAWAERLRLLGVPDFTKSNEETRPESLFRIFGADWTKAQKVRGLMQESDYLRCDDPSTTAEIIANVERAASVRGIAGVVLRDTAAPGYIARPYAPRILRSYGAAFSNDPVLPLGYTEASRLAFLRKHGSDPIDLSPLDQGDSVYTGQMFHSYCTLQLPYFHDPGLSEIYDGPVGVDGSSADTTNALSAWYAFRMDMNTALIQRAVRVAAAASAPSGGVPVILRHEADRLGEAGTFYGSAEPPDANSPPDVLPKGSVLAPRQHASPPLEMDYGFKMPTPERAHRESKTIYYSITFPGDALSTAAVAQKTHFRVSMASELEKAAAWDGVVVDLSAITMKDALEILSVFPAADGH